MPHIHDRVFPLIAFALLACRGPAQSPDANRRPTTIAGVALHKCGTFRPTGGTGIDHPDCDLFGTVPSAVYAPVATWRIPVVVHVLHDANGNGNLPDSLIHSQIDVLNEDFRARAGTSGAGGTDTQIEFFLATTDPAGQPTSGITRHANTNWFNDTGTYWSSTGWNPARYLNIYTNQPSAPPGSITLGYALIPQQGTAGTPQDRIVIHYQFMGRPGLFGSPLDRGRTCTHEVGHYLGLLHTFEGGCGASACLTTGDLVCDTPAEAQPTFGCPLGAASCGAAAPIHNYMAYTDDTCMTGFTQEQARRMRCTMLHYRPALWQPAGPAASATERNGAGNLNGVFHCSVPRLGAVMTVSLATQNTPYSVGAVWGYVASGNQPLAGFTLLVDPASTLVLQLPFQVATASGTISWSLPLPSTQSLAGLPISMQGLAVGATYALTNAVDLVVGQ